MKKHTILFLAANPSDTNPLALDREARASQVELERSGYRDCFEFETRWAVEPLDLLRELRKFKPTVVHFSGHGDRDGVFFQGPDGRAQIVTTAALSETFGAAGASVQLVVLSACYSEAQAEALLAHVDCVVGMGSSIHDDAARSFAIGFYGGLGEREPVSAAFKQGRAAISLMGLRDSDQPQLRVRRGVDANQLILGALSEATSSRRMPSSQNAEPLPLSSSQSADALHRPSSQKANAPRRPSSQRVDALTLHKKLVAQFSRDELALLCMEVEERLREDGVDEVVSLDVVGGQSTPEIARNLIGHLQRRGLLSYLVDVVWEHRPQDTSPPQLAREVAPGSSPFPTDEVNSSLGSTIASKRTRGFALAEEAIGRGASIALSTLQLVEQIALSATASTADRWRAVDLLRFTGLDSDIQTRLIHEWALTPSSTIGPMQYDSGPMFHIIQNSKAALEEALELISSTELLSVNRLVLRDLLITIRARLNPRSEPFTDEQGVTLRAFCKRCRELPPSTVSPNDGLLIDDILKALDG